MPKWFVIGCGVVLLNLAVVLGSVVFRHAVADDLATLKTVDDGKQTQDTAARLLTDTLPPGDLAADRDRVAPGGAADSGQAAAVGGDRGVSPDGTPASEDPLQLPKVPSIETVPPSVIGVPTEADLATGSAANQPGLLTLEDFKRVFAHERDLGELPPAVINAPQLSQGFFDALELRLDAVSSLNEAAKKLIQEAFILYQRGEINESRNLLGKATQLRELAAQLLVTRQ